MKRMVALIKIAELSSFTKAAETLGYTQSAISQMIASLENELSIKLLDRSRSGAYLTIEGQELFPYIQQTVYNYEAMIRKSHEINGLETGIIRIGTISSISCHWLPPLIKRFKENYPLVQFVLHQGDYTSIPEWVRINQVDFGFVNPDAPIKNLEKIFIKKGELRAVLPSNHRLASKDIVTLQDLADEPFIQLEEGSLSEPLEAFASAGLSPNISMCIHDDYSILSMIENEMGISILPELVLRKTNYDIAVRSIDPPVTRKISIVLKEYDSLPIASQHFIDYLMKHVEMLP